ncbi:MAG: ABC transporter permease subunit [bacterium]
MTINFKNENLKNMLLVFLAFLLVYITLFEFILPVNRILPKPSLLWESFIALWAHYSLLQNFLVTGSVVYLGIIAGYLIISFLSGYLIKLNVELPGFFNGLRLFRYFPAFFFAMLFSFWFEGSLTGEYIFAISCAVIFIGIALNNSLKEIKSEYVYAALSLGIKKEKIYRDVIWKLNQPAVVRTLSRLHIYLWTLILIFEFIGASSGLGNVYRFIIYYNDFAALFASAVFISVVIWIGNILIGFIENKLIRWEA